MELTLTDHIKIYYELIDGKREMPYLVFLHDGLGCCGMWKEFPAELCRRTGCPGLLYDRAGYGASSSQETHRTIHYLHTYALIELPAVLHSIIGNNPYILMGHSDGGSIALIHAAERPPFLQAVVSEAAHVFVEPETRAGINRTCHAFNEGKLRGLRRYHGKKAETVFNAWSQTWLNGWFQQWNIEYLLPAIDCPLLIIQGTDDEYATDRQVEVMTGATGPRTQSLLIDKCGHIPHREQPETVLKAVTGFIQKVTSCHCMSARLLPVPFCNQGYR